MTDPTVEAVARERIISAAIHFSGVIMSMPSPATQIERLEANIKHLNAQIEWKGRDEIDHTIESVLKERAEKRLGDLRRAAAAMVKP